MPSLRSVTLECGPVFRVSVQPTGRVIIEADDAQTSGADSDPIYDKRGVAERLKVSKRAIDNYMRQKKNPLPYTKSGGSPRFRETNLQQWLSEGLSVAARRLVVS